MKFIDTTHNAGAIRKPSLRMLFLLLGLLSIFNESASAQRRPETVRFRVLHTNDIHSQYRPDKGGFQLGGISRLATAIRRARAEVTNSILLDGGDWSEGKIYYQLDGGRTALEMMNALGYDAAVVGNHDWLNGPRQLLSILNATPPRFPLLGANLDFSQLIQSRELSQRVVSDTILNVGPLRVGVIGVCTFELIYDRYFQDSQTGSVSIEYPFPIVRRIAERLHRQDHVDYIIVISHNSKLTNRYIAELPYVDLVIHAHDHLKFTQPLVVPKPVDPTSRPEPRVATQALMVEAEKWGHYLGNLDVTLGVRDHSVNYNYRLIQIDSTIPQDPAIERMVNNYEAELTSLFERNGDSGLFTREVARTGYEISGLRESEAEHGTGSENIYANMLADAYREATHADVAFEQINLTSGGFAIGAITTSDIISALGQIFNPLTGLRWTLESMRVSGTVLRDFVGFLFFIQGLAPGGLPAVSGMHVVYDPAAMAGGSGVLPLNIHTEGYARGLIRIEVGGQPLQENQIYKITLSRGLQHALEFLERRLGYHMPRTEQADSGLEQWRVLRDYMTRVSTQSGSLQANQTILTNRYQKLSPDLAIYSYDIDAHRTTPGRIDLIVHVHNYGETASAPRTLRVGYDATPSDTTDDPNILITGDTYEVPAIPPAGEQMIRAFIQLPSSIANEPLVPIGAYLNSTSVAHPLDDLSSYNDGDTTIVRLGQ